MKKPTGKKALPKKATAKKASPKKATGRGVARWTVSVFMVGDGELGPAMSRDLQELEDAGSSPDVNVLLARQETPRSRSEWSAIGARDETGQVSETTVVGSSSKANLDAKLAAFLTFVAKRYPAKHHLLVLWGHASGLEFGGLNPGSKRDQLRLHELSKVLAGFQNARGGQKLEILGFCACAVNKAEYALELRGEVDFLVSSQVGISTQMTWPFDDVVKRARLTPSIEPASFARQIVQSFEESYEPPPVALTALDLQQSESLGRRIRELSQAILDAIDEPGDLGELNSLCVLHAFGEALDAYPYNVEPVIDFFDFCRKVVREAELDVAVREQAHTVLAEGYETFVVENARSGPKLAALNGLSILAPDFQDPDWAKECALCFDKSSPMYLWRDTDWGVMTRRIHEFAMARQTRQEAERS